MAKILRDIEHVRWLEGYGKVQTTCDVNTETKEVFNIKNADVNVDDFIVLREYIVIDGKQYDCFTAYRCK